MSPDFLNALARAMLDPTAPLPADWPTGILGVFLLFCVPVGGGIPLGVVMGRDAGLSPPVTAALYLASDVVLAITTEPVLALLRWLSRYVSFLARLGHLFNRLSGSAGLQDDGVRGPLGLILFAFSVSPTSGRAAAAAAGHGFVSGWSLAIIGDMLYFTLLMVTTLWVTSIFGDDRTILGGLVLATWILPTLIRRLRRSRNHPQRSTPRSATSPTPAPAALLGQPLPGLRPSAALAGQPMQARISRKRSGRSTRRPTRGLHR